MYPHSNFPRSFVILLDIHSSPTHLAHCLQPTDCPCFWEQHYRSVGVRTHLAVSRFLTLEFAPAPVSQHSRWASGRHRTSASTSPCLPPSRCANWSATAGSRDSRAGLSERRWRFSAWLRRDEPSISPLECEPSTWRRSGSDRACSNRLSQSDPHTHTHGTPHSSFSQTYSLQWN